MGRWLGSLALCGLVLSMTADCRDRQAPATRWSGVASWYGGGERLHSHVAMGPRFDPEALEAAMWDVPVGSMVKVTNVENGRVVIVRVTDRGPARRLDRRVIDLTRGAFMTLAPAQRGLIPVIVQQVP